MPAETNATQTLRFLVLHLSLAFVGSCLVASPLAALQQAPSAPRATPQRGTVKAIDGSNLTISTDTGQQIVIAVSPGARVQRLAPGSTDLKTAETSALSDVAVGDRVLVTGTAGDSPASFNANRIILMKSGDIAQKREAEQQDWQKRGSGGIVSAVDATSGAITVSSGARKLQIATTPSTTFRRYADGSVKFEDAKPGTLTQIHPGDQMIARGAKSEDGTTIQAEEIVSGSFENLSGTILSIDATNNTVSLKDLATKRNVTVQLTDNSALHRLPPQAAAMLASRSRLPGTAAPGSNPGNATSPRASATGAGSPSSSNSTAPSGSPASPRAAGDSPAGSRPGGMGRSGGGSLSQIVSRLPAVPLSEFHAGDAVMIVAEQSTANAATLTAITVLAGVEPILAAAPSGASPMTLSPWSVGTGAPEGGGAQ